MTQTQLETGTLPVPSHTPGPWHVGGSQSWNGAPIVALDEHGNDIRIATVSRKADKALTQKEADARLISAAPEMFAALMRIAYAPEGGTGPTLRESIVIARRAISLAVSARCQAGTTDR